MEFSKYIPQSKQDTEQFLIIDSENESLSCEQVKPRLSLLSRKTCVNCSSNRKHINQNNITNRSNLQLSNFERRRSLKTKQYSSSVIDREILKAKQKLKLSITSCDILQKMIFQLVQQEAALKVEKYKRFRNNQNLVQRTTLGQISNGLENISNCKGKSQNNKQKNQKNYKNQSIVLPTKKFKTKQQSTPKYKKNPKKKCP